MAKSALITGITGQDGSYLAEFLLEKGYEVHGLVRRSSSFNTGRLDEVYQDPHEGNRRLFLHHGDLSDGVALVNLLRDINPDEVYNLAAQSHVRVSFDQPVFTGDVTGLAAIRLLEAIRAARVRTKIYQASSSEMFGATPAPGRSDAFLPAQPLWRREAVRVLGNQELPRGVRPIRRERDSFQSRIATTWRDVRRSEDHPGCRPHQGGLAAGCSWAISTPFATGDTPRVRGRDVANAAAPGAAGLRHRDEYGLLRPRLRAVGLRTPTWTGRSTFASTFAMSDRPRSTRSSATRRRPGRSRWEPKVFTPELARIMVDADIKLLDDERSGRLVRIDA